MGTTSHDARRRDDKSRHCQVKCRAVAVAALRSPEDHFQEQGPGEQTAGPVVQGSFSSSVRQAAGGRVG
eukprot:9052112-Pyramimonas_sp.AAC.1